MIFKKTKTFFLLVFGTLFFIHCNHQNQDQPVSNKNSEKDSSFEKNSISTGSISVANNSKTSLQSEITCPKCSFKKMEILPTDVCKLKYTCENCKADLFPKEGDCCVFCSYGNYKCPSKQ